jgi:hypothetical protein
MQRTEEYNWLMRHPDEVSRYSGEYIAVVGESIVAHGKSFKSVFNEAQKHGDPLMHKVPPADKEMII